MRGISLDDLSALTKIPRRSLERLEDGAFDGQSDGFSRGFVRTVAEALGLEAEEAVLRLLGEPDEADDAGSSGRARWIRGASIAVAVAAVFAGLIAAGWYLVAALDAPDAGSPDASAIVYRRDAVRALAESQAGQEGAHTDTAGESVDSAGDDSPHPGADPSLGRDR